MNRSLSALAALSALAVRVSTTAAQQTVHVSRAVRARMPQLGYSGPSAPVTPVAPLMPVEDTPGDASGDTPGDTAGPSALYTHVRHPHTPRNVNAVHAAEHEAAGFNTRLAVWMTQHVGTMQCAYLFACIGIGSIVGVFTNNAILAAVCGSLSSYLLQLVLLPILSVGQNVLSRHQELQADAAFTAEMRMLHEVEQIARHLTAQDAELVKQTALLTRLATHEHVDAAPATPATPATPTAKPAPPVELPSHRARRQRRHVNEPA